jgi:hypothetical protein
MSSQYSAPTHGAEQLLFGSLDVPQRLKPGSFCVFAARLEAVPFQSTLADLLFQKHHSPAVSVSEQH